VIVYVLLRPIADQPVSGFGHRLRADLSLYTLPVLRDCHLKAVDFELGHSDMMRRPPLSLVIGTHPKRPLGYVAHLAASAGGRRTARRRHVHQPAVGSAASAYVENPHVRAGVSAGVRISLVSLVENPDIPIAVGSIVRIRVNHGFTSAI
jgi:hypothetical protein